MSPEYQLSRTNHWTGCIIIRRSFHKNIPGKHLFIYLEFHICFLRLQFLITIPLSSVIIQIIRSWSHTRIIFYRGVSLQVQRYITLRNKQIRSCRNMCKHICGNVRMKKENIQTRRAFETVMTTNDNARKWNSSWIAKMYCWINIVNNKSLWIKYMHSPLPFLHHDLVPKLFT